jgi:peptidoglycan/LPS O-acetylase OafA/YrhL
LRRLHLLRVDPSSGARIGGVEGLRAVAASSIVVFHVWLDSSPDNKPVKLGLVSRDLIPQLPLGVTLFFVLSGFLLYRPFAAALIRDQRRPSIRKYLRNRALRILPAYWFILLVVALVLQTALIHDRTGIWRPGRLDDPDVLARNALFVQNYTTPWQGSFFTGIGPAWSLAIEAVFYVALPLLVLLAFDLGRLASTRAGRRLAAVVPVATLLIVGMAGKVATFLLGLPGWGVLRGSTVSPILYWGFPTNADKFAFGMAVAVLYTDCEDRILRLPRWWPVGATAGLLAIALPAAKLTTNNAVGGDGSNLIYNALTALACALLLALVVLPRRDRRRPPALVRVLETRPLVVAGLVSYSLFLWHEPLIYWLHRHHLTLAGRSGFLVNLLLLATIAGVLSIFTYRWVELPALRRKRRELRGQIAAVPAREMQAAP